MPRSAPFSPCLLLIPAIPKTDSKGTGVCSNLTDNAATVPVRPAPSDTSHSELSKGAEDTFPNSTAPFVQLGLGPSALPHN